jgi:hypothetical protein
MKNDLAKVKEQLPKDWAIHLQQVRNLYCLAHIESGKKINVYGTTWTIKSGHEALTANWDIPLVLDDPSLNPEEYTINACYPCNW